MPRDEAQNQGHQCNDNQQRPEIDVELNDEAIPEDPARGISGWKLHFEIGNHSQNVLKH